MKFHIITFLTIHLLCGVVYQPELIAESLSPENILQHIDSVQGESLEVDEFLDQNVYKKELKAFKKSKKYNFICNREVNPLLREIRRDIENYQVIRSDDSKIRSIFTAMGAIVVTSQSMPKLYAYIDAICKKHSMATPTIFITTWKGFFNAAAAKLFFSKGGIIIGQDLLLQVSDEALEAIVAHEIGHIKHNHANKSLALSLTFMAGGLLACYTYKPLGKVWDAKAEAYVALWLSGICAQVLTRLCIGKRFERQADEFAHQEMKSEGVVQFFELIQEKEKQQEADFNDTYQAIQDNRLNMDLGDFNNLSMRFYITKGMYKLNRAFAWIYHHTPFGPHPSHEERIKTAKRYIENKQNNVITENTAVCLGLS